MSEIKENALEQGKTIDSGEGKPAADTNADYLEAIKDLKANSVSRADYDKLKSENKKLLDTIVNGNQAIEVDTSLQKDPKEVIKELRTELYVEGTDNMSNLDYITKTLKLREELIKQGKPDPFEALKVGSDMNNYVDGGYVAEKLQEMVDAANGDPNHFNAEYMRLVEPLRHTKEIDKQ